MTAPNLPAVQDNNASTVATGLEDLDPNEIAIPRIRVEHAKGVFIDSLTGEEFPTMYGVLLGMVRQRVMWAKEVVDGGRPQCKSSDAITGFPNMEGPDADSKFPWAASGLAPEAQPTDEHGRIVIACNTCPFAQWGPRKANGKSDPPPCKERFTFPIMYSTKEGGVVDRAGIVSFQGSGIKPSKDYMASFVRSSKSLYTAITEISLDMQKKGMVVFSTPRYKRIGDTAESEHEAWKEEMAQLRDFLRRAPRFNGEDDGDTGSAYSMPATSSPAQATTAAQSAPVRAQATTQPASVVDAAAQTTTLEPTLDNDDELPF